MSVPFFLQSEQLARWIFRRHSLISAFLRGLKTVIVSTVRQAKAQRCCALQLLAERHLLADDSNLSGRNLEAHEAMVRIEQQEHFEV